jgi:hypothetical protein
MIESCLFSSRRTWHCLVKIFAENTIGKCCRFFFYSGGDLKEMKVTEIWLWFCKCCRTKGDFIFLKKGDFFSKQIQSFFWQEKHPIFRRYNKALYFVGSKGPCFYRILNCTKKCSFNQNVNFPWANLIYGRS